MDLTAELQRRIQAIATRYYRKILRISYKDHLTNEEVQQTIRPHKDLTIVKRQETAVVWACLPFIRSGQNLLARHSERGMKTRQTEDEIGRQDQGIGRPEVPEGSGELGKMRGDWLGNHLWCTNDPRCQEIDEMRWDEMRWVALWECSFTTGMRGILTVWLSTCMRSNLKMFKYSKNKISVPDFFNVCTQI